MRNIESDTRDFFNVNILNGIRKSQVSKRKKIQCFILFMENRIQKRRRGRMIDDKDIFEKQNRGYLLLINIEINCWNNANRDFIIRDHFTSLIIHLNSY